ncbi:MAG: hypothetical protein WD037_03745 [Balneolales bacterium]
MNTILDQFEDILNTGYTILMELENEEPDFVMVKELYTRRFSLLKDVDESWRDQAPRVADMEQNEAKVFRNTFARLNLLEKSLNRNLRAFKIKKSDLLGKIDSFRHARSSYNMEAEDGSTSLFLDLKSEE